MQDISVDCFCRLHYAVVYMTCTACEKGTQNTLYIKPYSHIHSKAARDQTPNLLISSSPALRPEPQPAHKKKV